jgi:hypothetical protein
MPGLFLEYMDQISMLKALNALRSKIEATARKANSAPKNRERLDNPWHD